MYTGNNSQQTAPQASTLSILSLAIHENTDTAHNSHHSEAEGLIPSGLPPSLQQSQDTTAIPQEITPQRLIVSTLSVEELTKYHFRLPLDPQITKELIFQPKGLMKHLFKVPVENATLEINWKDVVLQEEAYEEFLAFILLRLNHAYWKYKESQDEVSDFISELLVPSSRLFNQKLARSAEGLRMRLIFLFNMTQGLLEAQKEPVLEILPALFTVTKIFAPFTEKTEEMIIEFMQQKFKEIVNSDLFLKGVEKYFDCFEHKNEAVNAVQACKILNFSLFGVKTITRILGMITPDGIALNLRHYLCPEDLEPRKSQYLVSLIHLLGQFIAKMCSFKKKNKIAQNQGELFRDENKGYLFQFIIFGDLKQWWRDATCRKKLIDVHEWPGVLPLFTEDERATVKKQKIVPTCNSSMLLTSPIHVGY